MTCDEFIKRFAEESPMYHAWGKFVCQEITAQLNNILPKNHTVDTFLKVPVIPRLKSITSILNKAFSRNKIYSDPYKEINDKVGIRFVVLLIDDIQIISDIITSNDKWQQSEDRDFQKERKEKPLVFDYQSKHYVVTNKQDFIFEGVSIKKDVDCEIQIRTLLQHAYCELTHDTIYKPKMSIEPTVQRIVARSMALIETTDEYFTVANNKIKDVTAYIHRTYDIVRDKYTDVFHANINDYDQNTNDFIIDALKDIICEVNIDHITSFIDKYSFIKDRINERKGQDPLYSQPVILLTYFLVQEKTILLKRDWPLSESQLKPIFTDLGISFNSDT